MIDMKFEISKSVNGQFYFVIKGSNGEKLCMSETYIMKQSAIDTINVIKREASTALVVDTTLLSPLLNPLLRSNK